jgi:hypothetical protein
VTEPDFKFILVPGWVPSTEPDGAPQFVSLAALFKLYDLRNHEAVATTVPASRRTGPKWPQHWIELGPRHRGDYAEHIATIRAGLTRSTDVLALV